MIRIKWTGNYPVTIWKMCDFSNNHVWVKLPSGEVHRTPIADLIGDQLEIARAIEALTIKEKNSGPEKENKD